MPPPTSLQGSFPRADFSSCGNVQAKKEEGGTTFVRWAFRFSPLQAGSDRFVPFIVSGTNLYVQELEKLAAASS